MIVVVVGGCGHGVQNGRWGTLVSPGLLDDGASLLTLATTHDPRWQMWYDRCMVSRRLGVSEA